jgi:hypothetical protein
MEIRTIGGSATIRPQLQKRHIVWAQYVHSVGVAQKGPSPVLPWFVLTTAPDP